MTDETITEGRGVDEIRADYDAYTAAFNNTEWSREVWLVNVGHTAAVVCDSVPSLLAEVERAQADAEIANRENNRNIERNQELVAALAAVRGVVQAVEALSTHLAYISRTVTGSYPDGMADELVMRRRVGKIWVEAGELGDAIEGWTGENPRKGVYASRDDVIKELIDCASASLCALEYMTGDKGESVVMLARQVAGNAQRLSESIPDACEHVEPVAAAVPTQDEPKCEHGTPGGGHWYGSDTDPDWCEYGSGPAETKGSNDE